MLRSAPLTSEARLSARRAASGERSLPASPADDCAALAADGVSPPAALTRVVEGEIIPRLLLAHRALPAGSAPGAGALRHGVEMFEGLRLGPQASEVDRLAADSIHSDAWSVLRHVEAYLAQGTSVESLLVDLFAPAARRLGEWWEQDACDFIDVTMGLWRLQEVMHEVAAGLPDAPARAPGARAALFAAAPGDTHVFGAIMAETCFRRAGWRTATALDCSAEQLEARVGESWFDLAGISVSTEDALAGLPLLIGRLRRASRNPQLVVMVGGWLFAQTPGLAERVGADGTSADARAAVGIADRLCNRISQPGGRLAAGGG